MMSSLARLIRDEIDAKRRKEIDAMSQDQLRKLWDTLPEDGSPHVVGDMVIDCDDIHAALNRKGDGVYCAV